MQRSFVGSPFTCRELEGRYGLRKRLRCTHCFHGRDCSAQWVELCGEADWVAVGQQHEKHTTHTITTRFRCPDSTIASWFFIIIIIIVSLRGLAICDASHWLFHPKPHARASRSTFRRNTNSTSLSHNSTSKSTSKVS
jgi:hypothetical protein